MTNKEEQVKNVLQQIAKGIDEKLQENFGFCLLYYEFGDTDGRALLYVSNSDRNDVTKAMEEFIEKTRGDNYGKHIK